MIRKQVDNKMETRQQKFRRLHPDYDTEYYHVRVNTVIKPRKYSFIKKHKPGLTQNERRAQLKNRVFTAYGNKCTCCGEAHVEFLSIDHVFGNGAQHRKVVGSHLYEYLEKNNFPKKEYTLLCMNCNFAKGKFGYCPHKRKEAK